MPANLAARPTPPKPELYTKDILRLAASLPHADALGDADASATRRSPVCGSEMRADVKVENGHLTALALRGRACAMGQASAAVVREFAVGRSAEAIADARAALAQALVGDGGFDRCWPELAVFESARSYPARHAAILLPFDAVLAAMTGAD
ncbi:iron-sulfur cluster assembly scaffold protein [Sphingorhabdus pulchriflava]|uniref:Iron-sulfur cluster assembly scaffold protein n=1 Tax=Sphingorhabdus pulchriflava TaxID=2292257 RepID=A0A371BJL5_9SPHN|nr:iron-sulfur cluster assembly scaffold protein [Sphingorhabdus pulchriflava]RDV07551.1 iron-sulfur cluster assembly scaffold protein [Sphingorhabdus pulchriflava]